MSLRDYCFKSIIVLGILCMTFFIDKYLWLLEFFTSFLIDNQITYFKCITLNCFKYYTLKITDENKRTFNHLFIPIIGFYFNQYIWYYPNQSKSL